MATPLSISFIVPVHDDAARLARCLASIRQLGRGRDVEIVVADGGSRDGSDAIARAAGAIVVSAPNLSVAAMRNRAAALAGSDVLAFVDADHELDGRWLATAEEALTPAEVGAAGASYEPPSDATWVQRTYDLLRAHPSRREPARWLASGNLVVRRAAFERVGGFDTRLRTCEDVDLCQRLRRAGYHLMADPGLRSIHYGDPATLVRLFRAELWRGQSNLRVTLRERSSQTLASLGVSVAQLALMLCALALLGRGQGLAALACGACAVMLSLARATRMVHRSPNRSRWLPLQAFAVALAYDAGRALALVLPTPHAVRRSP